MKKILILFGGNSFEHEISCMSVNFVKNNIDESIFDFKLVGIDKENNWYIVDNYSLIDENWINKDKTKIDNIISFIKDFDIIFPVMHGNTIEDGKIQSIFELYNIKFVGCNSYSSLICYDKLLTKLILEKYDISQVPYIIYNKDTNLNSIDYPIIIKPCKCGSSIGITVANNKEEAIDAIEIAKKYDNSIIIEKYLTNKRELECAVLETKDNFFVSDVGEIMNSDKWYDFESKYKTKTQTCISNIDEKIKKEVQLYSKKIFKVLKCRHISRIDFLFDTNANKLYFNEINTIPGFTEISMYPKLINNLGINPKEMITLLLNS